MIDVYLVEKIQKIFSNIYKNTNFLRKTHTLQFMKYAGITLRLAQYAQEYSN
jgi:hypothetical protein